MASTPPIEPAETTAPDDDEGSTGRGVSATDPAEGSDDAPGEQSGSAEG